MSDRLVQTAAACSCTSPAPKLAANNSGETASDRRLSSSCRSGIGVKRRVVLDRAERDQRVRELRRIILGERHRGVFEIACGGADCPSTASSGTRSTCRILQRMDPGTSSEIVYETGLSSVATNQCGSRYLRAIPLPPFSLHLPPPNRCRRHRCGPIGSFFDGEPFGGRVLDASERIEELVLRSAWHR